MKRERNDFCDKVCRIWPFSWVKCIKCKLSFRWERGWSFWEGYKPMYICGTCGSTKYNAAKIAENIAKYRGYPLPKGPTGGSGVKPQLSPNISLKQASMFPIE